MCVLLKIFFVQSATNSTLPATPKPRVVQKPIQKLQNLVAELDDDDDFDMTSKIPGNLSSFAHCFFMYFFSNRSF